MDDIRSVLSRYKVSGPKDGARNGRSPGISPIPDLFFDEILSQFKLNRFEIMVLMFLYRQVWVKPNLNAIYGIGPLQSYEAISKELRLSTDEVINVIHSLEKNKLIQSVRVGQYFVRKFFTEEFDLKYGQTYDEFF